MKTKQKNKSIYKVIDSRGRITLPEYLRELSDIQEGDIVEIFHTKKGILISKLDVIKASDNSKENILASAIAYSKQLDSNSLNKLIKSITEINERNREVTDDK